ncbi:MAG: ImmA/IrrE family metallo-endopeptidase [Herminiimonas sp.]|nr:ImmA/IrrE family metallo-endopeptidase [Herminiimonas sp.]
MTAGDCAEAIISDLGIDSPEDVDVDAIAFDAGLEVIYEPTVGCEATLVGFENRGIATINPGPVVGRRRFSVAHEIGHWHLHRGRSFKCRVDDADNNLASSQPLEKEADTFASHLLMPGPLFNPRVDSGKYPDFDVLADIATQFKTSLMATFIRLATCNRLPVVVACYGNDGRRWTLFAKDIPKRWFLKRKVDEDSFAYDLLKSGKERRQHGKQSADAWFENDDAGNFELSEQCVASFGGRALVVLYLESAMLEAQPDWNNYNGGK